MRGITEKNICGFNKLTMEFLNCRDYDRTQKHHVPIVSKINTNRMEARRRYVMRGFTNCTRVVSDRNVRTSSPRAPCEVTQ